MSDLTIVTATIRAAEIQAAATMSAAYYGAVGIALGLLVSWITALSLQNSARIRDTKRDVYLEYFDTYSSMIMGLSSILLSPPDEWGSRVSQLKVFSEKIDKVCLICNSDTDTAFGKAIPVFINVIEQIDHELANLRSHYYILGKAQEEYNMLVNDFNIDLEKLEGLKAQGNYSLEFSILSVTLYKKIGISEKKFTKLEELKKIMRDNKILTQVSINQSIKNLNIAFKPVINLLRKEIGIKAKYTKQEVGTDQLPS